TALPFTSFGSSDPDWIGDVPHPEQVNASSRLAAPQYAQVFIFRRGFSSVFKHRVAAASRKRETAVTRWRGASFVSDQIERQNLECGGLCRLQRLVGREKWRVAHPRLGAWNQCQDTNARQTTSAHEQVPALRKRFVNINARACSPGTTGTDGNSYTESGGVFETARPASPGQGFGGVSTRASPWRGFPPGNGNASRRAVAAACSTSFSEAIGVSISRLWLGLGLRILLASEA